MKKLITLFTALLLSLSTVFSQENLLKENTSIYNGKGTENDPYLITNAEELDYLRTFRNAEDVYFRLANDINLTDYLTNTYKEEGWLPIGDYTYEFMGHIDGNGYRISGLWINRPEYDDVGLFGVLYFPASIHNLIVEVDKKGIKGAQNVGGLVGTSDAIISNCAVTGNGMIMAEDYAGGLVGFQQSNEITGCYSTVNVYSNNTTAGKGLCGGLAGALFTASISNSYAAGIVNANLAGGLVGLLIGDINDSYAAGRVSGTEYAGGLVADDADGILTNCFFDKTTTGQEESGSFGPGGTALTTSELIAGIPFNALKSDQTWRKTAKSYPYLSWQESSKPEENNVPEVTTLAFYNADDNELLASQINNEGVYLLPDLPIAVYMATNDVDNFTAHLPYTKESPLLLSETDTEYPFYIFSHSLSGIVQPSVGYCMRISNLSSNENVLNDLYIQTSPGRITIDTPTSIPVAIYSTTGKVVISKLLQQGSNSIELSAGVYILRIKGESIKIMIR